MAVAGECLRILFLLQTLSKSSECQRGLVHLLLEAIVMIFSATEDGLSVVRLKKDFQKSNSHSWLLLFESSSHLHVNGRKSMI